MPTEIVFTVEADFEDGGYTAACFEHHIFTQGDNFEELREMVMDAVALTFEGEAPPLTVHLNFVEPFRAPAPRLP